MRIVAAFGTSCLQCKLLPLAISAVPAAAKVLLMFYCCYGCCNDAAVMWLPCNCCNTVAAGVRSHHTCALW